MSLKAALEDLQNALADAPEALAVIPVRGLPPFVENFHLPATVDAKQLKAATDSGLPIVLAAHIDPSRENPSAAELQPFAVRATVFFSGPDRDGKTAVVFETGDRVRVRYSDSGGNIVGAVRPDDFWHL